VGKGSERWDEFGEKFGEEFGVGYLPLKIVVSWKVLKKQAVIRKSRIP